MQSDRAVFRQLARTDAVRRNERQVVQDAQDILVVMDKEPAEVAVSLAQDCLTSLIDSYGDKCASVEDYHNQAQEALRRPSSEQLGSIFKRQPDFDPPHISTLHKLTEENLYLQKKLKDGPDVHCYNSMFEDYTRQADEYTPALCARKYQEMQQCKTSMLYHEPNEYDVLMLRQQLAAGDRQLRYERSLRLRDQQRTQACAQKSSDEAALFAQQSASLQEIIDAHSQPEQAPPTLHSVKQPQQFHTVAVSAVNSRQTPAAKSAAAYKAAVIKHQSKKFRQAAQQDEYSHQLPLPSSRTAHNPQSKEQAASSGSSHKNHERYASQPSSRFSNKR